ncbi:hypothetical protein THAOC_24968 [Thalassiosira oceanica]|uniref:Uncharacterized protein n=1 Tax=Thalassiosira oceanica TaxID=159749 RepID=K0S2T4_THAOC|nr:hypothetical protein THAOC_24968 [Thalassiosira oceanica]|eukprot:EJK55311.1 hypothetical protein THAOC_24968 [Thalassiosira oceanica]
MMCGGLTSQPTCLRDLREGDLPNATSYERSEDFRGSSQEFAGARLAFTSFTLLVVNQLHAKTAHGIGIHSNPITKSRKWLDTAFIVVAPHVAVVAGTSTVREPGAVLLSVVVVTVLAFGFVAAKIDANPGKTRARVALDLPVGTRMAAPVRDLGAVRRQGRIVVEARLFRVVVAADLLTVMSAPDRPVTARAPVRGLCACLILVAPFLVAVAFTALGSIRASPGPLTETVAQNLTGVARDFVGPRVTGVAGHYYSHGDGHHRHRVERVTGFIVVGQAERRRTATEWGADVAAVRRPDPPPAVRVVGVLRTGSTAPAAHPRLLAGGSPSPARRRTRHGTGRVSARTVHIDNLSRRRRVPPGFPEELRSGLDDGPGEGPPPSSSAATRRRPLVVVIAGPTAVGKSDAAAELCAPDLASSVLGVGHGGGRGGDRLRGLRPGLPRTRRGVQQARRGGEVEDGPPPDRRGGPPRRRDRGVVQRGGVDEGRVGRHRHARAGRRRGGGGGRRRAERPPGRGGGTMMYLQWLVHGRPDAVRPSDAAAERAASRIASFRRGDGGADEDEDGAWMDASAYVSSLGPVFEGRVGRLPGRDWYRLRRLLEVAYTMAERRAEDAAVGEATGGEEVGGRGPTGADRGRGLHRPTDRQPRRPRLRRPVLLPLPDRAHGALSRRRRPVRVDAPAGPPRGDVEPGGRGEAPGRLPGGPGHRVPPVPRLPLQGRRPSRRRGRTVGVRRRLRRGDEAVREEADAVVPAGRVVRVRAGGHGRGERGEGGGSGPDDRGPLPAGPGRVRRVARVGRRPVGADEEGERGAGEGDEVLHLEEGRPRRGEGGVRRAAAGGGRVHEARPGAGRGLLPDEMTACSAVGLTSFNRHGPWLVL